MTDRPEGDSNSWLHIMDAETEAIHRRHFYAELAERLTILADNLDLEGLQNYSKGEWSRRNLEALIEDVRSQT